MKKKDIEKYLDELSEETDFSFTVCDEENGYITLYMQGGNPENEDWCETLVIQYPNTKDELVQSLRREVDDCYRVFDIEENVYLMLEAKRNGFQGIPDVVALVHNEEYKENALYEFSEKLRRICFR